MRFQKISPCLWFDGQAEEAANFYTSIFDNSHIVNITHYGEAGHQIHGRPAGSVLTVVFELDGQSFTALNGGPFFQFSEAISLQVFCQDQSEIDYFWEKLSAGGDPNAQQCGWLKDRFGLSWQVVPAGLSEMLSSGDYQQSERVMTALLQMKKLNIASLQLAYKG